MRLFVTSLRVGTLALAIRGGVVADAQSAVVPPPGSDVVILQRPGGPAGPPLPPLADDAQRLVDQWKQERLAFVEQLRLMQQQYRDSGHADQAAAIAANIRAMQPRSENATGAATAELANDGLPSRDDPIPMAAFRNRPNEPLTFAIRGRDDQAVWGTNTYTDDSGLESAAVHAGLLRAGQTALVKVLPLPGQERYEASDQHGVRSAESASARGSFRFVSASVTHPARSSSLSSYRDLIGQSITVPVIGAASRNMWGTDVYTDDSQLGAVAVHAGAAAVGELSYVKVTFLPGQDRYEGSSRNGVSSQSFGAFQGSVRIEPASPAPLKLPGGEDGSPLLPVGQLRGRSGVGFDVEVTGSTTGVVYGSGPYTDDSSIAAAAVHAGLLKSGETGMIRVVVDNGRESYPSSDRNGIRTQAYGPWGGSFRLERAR
jgi:hypothetical protein